MPGYARLEMEDNVLLQDVFDPAAKLYELVAPFGEVSLDVYVLTLGYRNLLLYFGFIRSEMNATVLLGTPTIIQRKATRARVTPLSSS